jgi:hypothetical protein
VPNIPPPLYVKEREAAWPKLRSRHPDRYVSVLFDADPGAEGERASAPDFFGDLNLNPIVAAATRGRDEYRLAPIYNAALGTPDAIVYRQQAMRDAQQPDVRNVISEFAKAMSPVSAYGPDLRF